MSEQQSFYMSVSDSWRTCVNDVGPRACLVIALHMFWTLILRPDVTANQLKSKGAKRVS